MIRSIRYFLLISLLTSITIASAITAVGNYLMDEQVVQPFLDSQLTKISAIIDLLSQSAKTDEETRNEIVEYLRKTQHTSLENFIFQVWSKDGELLLHSTNFALSSLKDTPLGFTDKELKNDEWRIYATYDKQRQVKIIVAEMYNLRRELADDIARNNAYILLVTYPLFGILVWVIVSIALRSVTRVTSEISNRASTYLEPVEFKAIPTEIKPLVTELNRLFGRLKLAFERNKRFAADAAHELRTPLAALKTHAQVALKEKNEKERSLALVKMIQGVDRSSHVVAQLLTLSRLGEEESLSDMKMLDLHKLATEIIASLAPLALDKDIEIELSNPPANTTIMGNEIALGILIRNIVDNAIRYTPQNGEVKVEITNRSNQVILRVSDSGPGIPIELRERVFERFFRMLGTTASGSGLGLAIVVQIAKLHHADISLNTPTHGTGLQFNVAFPKYPS